MAGPFESAAWLVGVPFSAMFTAVLSGLFDKVELELGLQHYAEMPWFPLFNVMPLNTVINLGYIGLGLFWCGFTSTALEQGMFKGRDCLLFYIFNIMASCYGCVQLLRILSHHVVWAVLDQWCTLPFFAFVFVWGLYLTYGWSSSRAFLILMTSIMSYCITLFCSLGFEIILGIHMACAITGGVLAYKRYPAAETLSTLYQALLSCSGFVFLKLFDHRLVQVSSVFKVVSGHFLSKICDIYQIHLVNNFFLDLTLEKAAANSLEEKANVLKREEPQTQRPLTDDIIYEFPRRRRDT
ncbi:transmembrane protein 187 [Plakobranchus ocellatus]|uniref:Transmembrane protein 187 n=1 Tax=Plakobranchus ocellatus TaxID=259542 RepID=A0AAV4DJ84_9GAST|nr:transmembrane protein 187 [Plakobranchus ocellatus]